MRRPLLQAGRQVKKERGREGGREREIERETDRKRLICRAAAPSAYEASVFKHTHTDSRTRCARHRRPRPARSLFSELWSEAGPEMEPPLWVRQSPGGLLRGTGRFVPCPRQGCPGVASPTGGRIQVLLPWPQQAGRKSQRPQQLRDSPELQALTLRAAAGPQPSG